MSAPPTAATGRSASAPPSLLASKHIASGQYDSAQALLDRLPERSAMDKRLLQANLGQTGEAGPGSRGPGVPPALRPQRAPRPPAAPWPRSLEGGPDGDADRCGNGRQAVDLFGQWSYAAAVLPFQLAPVSGGRRSRPGPVSPSELLEAVPPPWDCRSSPAVPPPPAQESSGDFGAQFLPCPARGPESDPGCGFLPLVS